MINFGTVLSGTVIAQALGILATPIISRLFTPENIGMAAIFGSIVKILMPASTFSYSQAIVLPEDEREAFVIFFISFGILLVLTTAVALSTVLANLFVPNTSWVKSLGACSYLVALGLFLGGTGTILNNWSARKKQFRSIAASKITSSSITPGLKIAIGYFKGASGGALILSTLIGALFQILVLMKNMKDSLFPILHLPEWKNVKKVLKAYRDFPLFNLPSSFFTQATTAVPVLLLSYFCEEAIVGYYAMANRLLAIPLQLILQSVSQVYLQKVAELKNAGKSLKENFVKATIALFCVGILPFVLIGIFAELIFTIFLGLQWSLAGQYAQILSPWLFTSFCLPPTNALLIVMRKNRFRLYFHTLSTIIRCLSLFLGLQFFFDTPQNAILCFSLISSFVNMTLFAITLRFSAKIDTLVEK